jgi:pimeloyl-ACP methyl ester carboxylesterase
MSYTSHAGVRLYDEATGAGSSLVLLHGRAGNGALWWR